MGRCALGPEWHSQPFVQPILCREGHPCYSIWPDHHIVETCLDVYLAEHPGPPHRCYDGFAVRERPERVLGKCIQIQATEGHPVVLTRLTFWHQNHISYPLGTIGPRHYGLPHNLFPLIFPHQIPQPGMCFWRVRDGMIIEFSRFHIPLWCKRIPLYLPYVPLTPRNTMLYRNHLSNQTRPLSSIYQPPLTLIKSRISLLPSSSWHISIK